MDDETVTNRICALIATLPTFVFAGDDDPLPGDHQIAVTYGAIPDGPDRAVGVRIYGAIDEPGLHARRVQLHIRGARRHPFGADRIAAVLFSLLHDRARGDGFVSIQRTSTAPLGADDNGREERTDNYLFTLDNQEASS